MKMTQIAKTSLALSLLTTGASIVTTQSANAEVASALKTEQAIKSKIQKVNFKNVSKNWTIKIEKFRDTFFIF